MTSQKDVNVNDELDMTLQDRNGATNGNLRLRNNYEWINIGNGNLPFIMRAETRYVCRQMVENVLLHGLLRSLDRRLVDFARVPCYRITDAEGDLLKDIVVTAGGPGPGPARLVRRQIRVSHDCLVRLDDAIAAYDFLEEFHRRLTTFTPEDPSNTFGYISITIDIPGQLNAMTIIPYAVVDGVECVPAFYVDTNQESPPETFYEIGGWAARRVRAACMIMSVRSDLYKSEPIRAVAANYFSQPVHPGIIIRKNWPRSQSQNFLKTNPRGQPAHWTQLN